MNTAEKLTMKGIIKSFPGVKALKGIDLDIRGGEIHALLGANGAGKSTLMKILSGACQADEGTITLGERVLDMKKPADAIRSGIQCVYQEVDTSLVPYLTVGENILLHRMALAPREGKGFSWIRWRTVFREAEQILAQLDSAIPVERKVEELTLSEKQLVLIARAISEQAKFIIFDEPTAPLSLEETKCLFQVMSRLKASGVGCIFISHRLPEVFEVADIITVMRDGQVVWTQSKDQTSIPEVIEAMLGRTLKEEYRTGKKEIGDPLLLVEGLTRGEKVRDVHLTLRRGEILGIAGLVGAGKTELSRLLFGADPCDSGQIRLNGRLLHLKEPKDAIQSGIVLVPEERRKEGILVEESVQTNLTLPSLKRFSDFGWIRSRREKQAAEAIVRELGVKTPSVEQAVGLLSGGNQQKVVIGKWLMHQAEVFLFDEPTKGIDVGAKSEVFRMMERLAQEGKGIIYFSSEISEILGICDRVLVMYDGRIAKELDAKAASQEDILFYASGGKD